MRSIRERENRYTLLVGGRIASIEARQEKGRLPQKESDDKDQPPCRLWLSVHGNVLLVPSMPIVQLQFDVQNFRPLDPEQETIGCDRL